MRRAGPYSRLSVLNKLDGRTRAARLAKDVRKSLTAHIGGRPSATQKMLIERAVQLTIRITAMDSKFAETGLQTEHDSRTYLAWSANLARVLRDLGMEGAAQRTPTLAEHKASRAAAAA